MITAAVAFVIGAVVAAALWALVRELFEHPVLARRNVRGRDVPTAGGIVIAVGMVPMWAAINIHVGLGWDVASNELLSGVALLPVVVVFALLGLVDDVLATGDERGFRGHLGALVRGRLTTGGLKMVGGGLAAVAVTVRMDSAWRWAIDAAVVALAANLANLLDRAPGRVTKVSVIALVALVAAGGADAHAALASTALVVGLAAGILLPELGERIMLGDTGANPLGAVLGVAAVTIAGTTATVVILVALLALNLASEKVSFSQLIDRVAALRWLDRLGRSSP